MDHANAPTHREEDCRDDDCRWHGHDAELRRSLAGSTTLETTPAQGFDLVLQVARADAASMSASHPYLLQSGRTLFIVASEPTGWVVAELTFDPGSCVFVEQSRARFDWPREAFGRLLSRVCVASDIDHETRDAIASGFERWLVLQFAN